MIIETVNLHKTYQASEQGKETHALKGVSMTIVENQITAVMGRSGAGKTTLLNLLGGLDTPDEGQVIIAGQNLSDMSTRARAVFRRDNIAYVFQNFGLLPLLTVAENISVPLRMRKLSPREREVRINEALDWVELRNRAKHRPYELSGGEQQRVALARALATQPRIILADEPTGQLDSQTGLNVLYAMRRLVMDKGITMVIATHDPQVQDQADMLYHLHDGVFSHSQ